MYTNFCFSELLILKEKKFADFFGAIGVPKKMKNFQKILKKPHTEEF